MASEHHPDAPSLEFENQIDEILIFHEILSYILYIL